MKQHAFVIERKNADEARAIAEAKAKLPEIQEKLANRPAQVEFEVEGWLFESIHAITAFAKWLTESIPAYRFSGDCVGMRTVVALRN